MADDQIPIAYQLAGAVLAGVNVTRRALAEVAREHRIQRELGQPMQASLDHLSYKQRVRAALAQLASVMAEPWPDEAEAVLLHLARHGVNPTAEDLRLSYANGVPLRHWPEAKPGEVLTPAGVHIPGLSEDHSRGAPVHDDNDEHQEQE